MTIFITEPAFAGLSEYKAYVANDSIFYAEHSVKRLIVDAESLRAQPYSEADEVITIMRFFHVKRLLKTEDI